MLSLSKFEITHKDLIIKHIQENAHRDKTRTGVDITRFLGGKIWQPIYEWNKSNKEIPLSWTVMTNEIEAHAFPNEGITIEPKENLFVMFNSNLVHGVEPSLDGRICIAMNF